VFFEEASSGAHCGMNWYEGSGEAHGQFAQARAPALLGFDNDIHQFCQHNCDAHNLNILNLFSGPVLYNTCRNFEWQCCAAQGKLPGQGSRAIKFARAPKTVSFDGYPRFGECSGYTNAACSKESGFANDDIFYLELCLFAMVCSNHARLFELEVAEEWECDWSEDGFATLQALLLA